MIRCMYKDLSKMHFRPELMFPFKLHEAVWRQQLISFDELTIIHRQNSSLFLT